MVQTSAPGRVIEEGEEEEEGEEGEEMKSIQVHVCIKLQSCVSCPDLDHL